MVKALDKTRIEVWIILLLQGVHRSVGLQTDDKDYVECLSLLRAIAKDILQAVEEEEARSKPKVQF
jgi:hypothetical protein